MTTTIMWISLHLYYNMFILVVALSLFHTYRFNSYYYSSTSIDSMKSMKSFTSRNQILYMNKKNKKAKNKDNNEITSSTIIPQRITNQINISIKQQIVWAKAKKRLESTVGSQHLG